MSEPEESTTRQIQVLGAKLTRRRRTRKLKSEETESAEDETTPLTPPTGPLLISKSQESIKVSAPKPENLPILTQIAPIVKAPIETSGASTQPPHTPVFAVKTKVVLKPKEKQVPKVLLKKKENIPGPELAAKPPDLESKGGAVQIKAKTRKVVLNSFHKRVNKTRHAISQAKELPIENIRAVLIDKKLIKPNSKAPESILRQIYSDSLIVAKKTL